MTPRLSIEPLLPIHAREVFDALTDTRLYDHMPISPPQDIGQLEREYGGLAGAPDETPRLHWLLRLRDSGGPVGTVQATPRGEHAHLAYLVFRDHWSKGYASEALGAIIDGLAAHGTRWFTATVDARNAASLRVLEKLGFTLAGRRTLTERTGETVEDLDLLLER